MKYIRLPSRLKCLTHCEYRYVTPTTPLDKTCKYFKDFTEYPLKILDLGTKDL